MPRPHRPLSRYCRCFSHRSPCRQGRRIPSKRSSDPRPRGSQRRRRNQRHCPAWSARRVDAEGAVRVTFGMVFLGELAFCISPIGRQRLHDVKAAVVGNEPVVVQIIHQICDLREALTFHNDKRTDHGFLRKAPPPGCRSGQREVQAAEKLVVERSGALGCEQRHILNDFLSVDSGQPLSGWFSLQANLTKKGLRFLYHLSDFRLQPWPGTVAITAFFAFCSWLKIII